MPKHPVDLAAARLKLKPTKNPNTPGALIKLLTGIVVILNDDDLDPHWRAQAWRRQAEYYGFNRVRYRALVLAIEAFIPHFIKAGEAKVSR